MKCNTILINTTSAFLGALYIIFFFKTIFDHKLNVSRKIIFAVMFGLLNGIVSSLMSATAIKPLALFIISISLIMILFRTKLLLAFLSFSIYIIGLAVGNAFMPIAVNLLLPGQTAETIQTNTSLSLGANLLTNLIVFLLFLLIKPAKSFIEMISQDKFLLLLTAGTVLVLGASSAMHFFTRNTNMASYIIIASISISYCVFIILMWFNALRRVIREEDLKQQKFYNESLRSALFELRRFKHDWINNLIVIDSMIKMNKSDELRQYVFELVDQCSQHVNTQIYDIRNAGLFGILSSKIVHANEKGVTVDLSVIGEIEDIPGVKISELCEMIGIFLDNAIEEASQGEKTISISIKSIKRFIEISISNSCTTTPDIHKIYIDGYSSKGENRGMGLTIAKKIIDKYKNILHITTFKDNIFTQTIEIENQKGL